MLGLHKVRVRNNDPHSAPYAECLDLGWVVIGDMCLARAHKPANVEVCTTNLLENGGSSFKPCSSSIYIKEYLPAYESQPSQPCQHSSKSSFLEEVTDNLGFTVLDRTKNDDHQPALSIEDGMFLEITDNDVVRTSSKTWTPFRIPRYRLPDNRGQALKRLRTLRRTLDKKLDLREHIGFMQKMLDNKHAEQAPPLRSEQERSYLPTFGACHPQKPGYSGNFMPGGECAGTILCC